jgi:hypothetical protein
MTQKVKPSTLADTSVVASTYGGQNQIPVFTVDQQGRLTYAANVSPIIQSSQIAGSITDSQISSVSNNKITGVITNAQIASVANTKITGNIISDSVVAGNWTITPSGTKVYFAYSGVNVFSVDGNGNIIAKGDITGFGTP